MGSIFIIMNIFQCHIRWSNFLTKLGRINDFLEYNTNSLYLKFLIRKARVRFFLDEIRKEIQKGSFFERFENIQDSFYMVFILIGIIFNEMINQILRGFLRYFFIRNSISGRGIVDKNKLFYLFLPLLFIYITWGVIVDESFFFIYPDQNRKCLISEKNEFI